MTCNYVFNLKYIDGMPNSFLPVSVGRYNHSSKQLTSGPNKEQHLFCFNGPNFLRHRCTLSPAALSLPLTFWTLF